MNKTPSVKRRPTTDKCSVPNVGELAARLFVHHYKPGGLTDEHQAQMAIDAAEAFVRVYETHR